MLPTPALGHEDMWHVQVGNGVDVMRGSSSMENREGQNFKALGTIFRTMLYLKLSTGQQREWGKIEIALPHPQPLCMQCQYWKCIVGKRGGLSH